MDNDPRKFLEERIDQPANDSPSPVGRWLEGILRELTDHSVTFEFEVREEMTNPYGVLHGGIIAAMADDVIGTAVFGLCDAETFTSVNLSLDYLSSVNLGETVYATGTILREGRRMIYAECELTDDAGETVAKATTNLVKTN